MNGEVVIYGAGNMGKAVLELLRDRCEIKGILDGNPALQGTVLLGVPICHPSDTTAVREMCNAAALVAMTAAPFSQMKEYLLGLGFSRVFPAGDYVSAQYAGDVIINTWRTNESGDTPSFSDEKSLRDYSAARQWFSQRADGDWALEGNRYFPDFLSRRIGQCKVMLDTAALDGGYINTFLNGAPDRSVYGYTLTPATVPIGELRARFHNAPVRLYEKEAAEQSGTIKCRRIGLMQPFTSLKEYTVQTERIDATMADQLFDYLRCYSMSEVLPILKGGENSILKYRPVIAADIGHYESDFWGAPGYLRSICPGYDFYFRMHGYQGNGCILYAVPQEMRG